MKIQDATILITCANRGVELGSYNWLWYIDITLAIGTALILLPIREARFATAAPGQA